jgi:type IV pilus assembly protein PilN
MAKINLLPWRDRLRERTKKEFLQACGLASVLGVFVLIIWSSILGYKIDNQVDRNETLKAEIATLDKQIAEVEGLKKKRTLLIDRMKVIQGLQSSRPTIVHIFDELVRTLPDGVYYTSLTRSGGRISVRGVADSNEEVSALMRKLDASSWFQNPILSNVTQQKSKNRDGTDLNTSAFVLQFSEEVVSTPSAKVGGATK